ncbi:uncharacterized protein LOC131941504 [Physella acuta]|uniref:uncharacterized protein LOC131941504 n=1 Tax=Physella acuta TaxID=109671 RepID=UPI0027DD0D9F|nr:uncharacterized protein LOC131941504 [Physella acuta]
MYVYPNVTNSTEDKKYGQTVVHNVTLEPPSVEIKVTNYTDVNGLTTFNCTCYRTDSSQIETTIQWYRNNTMIQHNNGTNVSTIQVSGPYDEYYCQATNRLGWTSQNVSCKPVAEEHITTAQSIKNCSANSSCLVENVGEIYNITASSNNTVSSNTSRHGTKEPSGYITVLIVFSAVLVIAVVLAAIFWKTIYPRIYHTTKIHKNEYELRGNDTDGFDTTWCLGEEDTESHYEELDKFRS